MHGEKAFRTDDEIINEIIEHGRRERAKVIKHWCQYLAGIFTCCFARCFKKK
jgi:hypothetical protein